MSDELDTSSAVASYLQSRQPEEAVRTSLSLAAGANPDAEAEYKRLARQAGLPIDSVRDNKDAVQQQVSAPNYGELAKQFPGTTQYLSTLENARIAHDDVGNLTGIEKAIRGFIDGGATRPVQRARPTVMNSQEFSAEVRRAMASNPALDFDTARKLVMDGATVHNQSQLIGPARGPAPTLGNIVKGLFSADRFRSASQGASVMAADILGLDTAPAIRRYEIARSRAEGADPEFESATARGIYGGGTSLIQNAPGIALSIMLGNPAPGLLMAGGAVGAESYGKYRARGGTAGEAAVGAASEAAVEVATEMLPMGFLVNKLGKAGAGEFLKGLLARELPGEQIATLAQDAIDTAIANPDKTWAQYIAERPGAAYQTLLATLTQTGAMGALNTVANRLSGFDAEAQRAEQSATRAQEFAGLIAQSKLRERDPEAFKQFVAEVADSGETPTEFYIDAQELANSLNQSAVTIEQLRAFAPAVAAQMDAAQLVPGADIRVPVAEFAAAPDEVTAGLIDHLRETPEAMSRAEAGTFLKEAGPRIQSEVEQAIGKEVPSAEFQQAVSEISAQFEQQLNTVGKFRPEVNKAYANLLGNFYAVQAQRAGVAPQEFMQRYRLGIAAKDTAGRQRLDQSPDAFARAFGNSGVPMSVGQVQAEVERITSKWKNGPPVKVLANHLELGHDTPKDVRGVFSKGTINIVARKHMFPDQVARTLAHEAVAHYGLRQILDAAQMAQLADNIQKAAAKDPKLAEIREYVRRAYVGKDGQVNIPPEIEAEEIAARAVELALDPKTGKLAPGYGFLKAVWSRIAQFLREQGIDIKFTNAELHGMLVRSMRNLIEGGSRTAEPDFALAARDSEQGSVAGNTLANEGHDESILPQALVDRAGPDAKQLADVLEGTALPPEFDGIGDLPPLLAMQVKVLAAARNDLEVIRSIVGAVPVSVMNDLALNERTAKAALRDDPMLKDGSTLDAQLTVARLRDGTDPVALLVREATRAATELPRVALGPRGEAQEGAATLGAGQGNSLSQGETSPRASLVFGDDITASPSVIALLEGADLSSFIHESGHFFLEVQADLASRIQRSAFMMEEMSEGERQIVTDMQRILNWFGVKADGDRTALDAWSMMTLEEKREHHETWARGFERYVMEGNAPSQELQALFSKFRAWLVSVYKTLAGLNVTLSDDVRQVMGRMLASDQAIAEAEAARAMGPLFQSPEQAGMTPDEFASYQALGARATAAADAELDARMLKDLKWLSRARDKAIKAAQAEADELRKEVEREVRAEVMAQPVYQAWQFLTGKGLRVEPGIQAAETIDTVRQSGKLRTSYLKESHPEQWKTLSERRMTSDESGMDPDIVASVIPGFTSGDELVKTLAAAPAPQTVIEELTDQQMLQRYGDITSQEALNRAADEAVHNEMRARVIATELQALEKAGTVRAGPRSTINVMARAAKDYAYQIIGRQRVRDLRPSQYSAAQARSAKLAEKAMGKSTEEAAMHKRNELINTYAARAAYDALAEVKAAQAYFRKFDKRVKGIDAGYQDQIDQLLESVELRSLSLKEIDRRKSFAEWYAEQRAAGNEPNVPEELLDEASRKSFKDMTVEELRGLRDTIKQIEHQGRLKNRLLLARDKRDFDAIASEVAASIEAHGGDARPVQLEGPNPVVDWFAGVAASHRKLASLFRQMDGNKDTGPLYEHIGRSMNERGTMEDVMVEKATMALRELYAPLLKMRGGISGYRSKVFIPEINDSLSRGGRLAVVLNWGNAANRQRIMDGDRWSDGQVRAIIKTLSPAELEFVNGVWAYIDTYWDQIAAKEKRLTGVEPEKVEAEPFNAIASDDRVVRMTGGYYPLKYDTDRSDRADTQEAAQAAKEMMQGAITRATTRRGHTKERLKEVKRAVRKDLDVITQHVTQVIHDLAWHEWLIDTNKLLSDEGIVSAIRGYYGPKVLKTMRDDVLGIATADAVPQSDVDKILLKLRSNVTRATMGASLTTAFLQPFGLTQSIVRIGGKHMLRGMARWGGDAARMENTVAWIHGKSDMMRLRAKTFNRELREIRGSVAGKSQTMRVVDAGLFVMMQKMQMVADVPTWMGQYYKSIDQGLDDAAAVAMADRAVLESQGGGSTKDLAEVQRKHPMLTQFYSYFSVTLNLAAEQTAATNFKNPAAVAGWLGDMALLLVIPAILPSFILYSLRGGDDDDEKGILRRMGEWQLGYLMGMVVGVRELSGAVSGFDYAGPPVGRLIGDAGKAGKQTVQGELDEPAVIAYINLLGSAFGIPTAQALRSYRGWKAWDEGQEGAGPQSILLGPPPKD